MKNQLFILVALAFLVLAACQSPTTEQSESMDYAAVEESESPDFAAFDEKVAIIRSFIQAHSDEDLDAQKGLLADTIKWSPPYYNGNQWLGKDEYVAAIGGYHNDFENIQYAEGIVLGDSVANGFWAGSIFPESSATNLPNAIRVYGTWTATHTETGKDIGVKWFAVIFLNEVGKMVQVTEFWDVHGLAAQIAAE